MKYLDEQAAADLIGALLKKFPESFSEINERREQIRQATAAFDSESTDLAVSVFETIRTLRMRIEQLQRDAEPPPLTPTTENLSAALTEEISQPDKTGPAPHRPDTAPEPVATTAARNKWSNREKYLYRDSVHLFELGDIAGAMTSLERLFMLEPRAEELSVFLAKNEPTLLRLYRGQLGSMDRVTIPSRSNKQVRIPTPDANLMLKIIRMSDGHRSIREFVKKAKAPELHVLIVISHLVRSGYLELA